MKSKFSTEWIGIKVLKKFQSGTSKEVNSLVIDVETWFFTMMSQKNPRIEFGYLKIKSIQQSQGSPGLLEK